MRMNPVIINQISAEFGAAVSAHASAPVVIDHIEPERPWELPEGEILVTNASAWRHMPKDFQLTPALKWVQTENAGIDMYPEALRRDRIMTCGRGLSAVPIAEFVFAALLRREKKLEDTRARSHAEWKHPTAVGTLDGRKLGLIGFGSLGQAIAHRARAFGMEILVSRRGGWKEIPEGVTPCASPAEVFATADHLVIAAPLTPETVGMVNAALLTQAKPGLHLINISRGALIDQQALIGALDAGQIGYATLDVTTPEPLPDAHPLYAHPGVFISPHISWMGGEKSGRFLQRFLDNLDAWLRNEPLRYLVDSELGY